MASSTLPPSRRWAHLTAWTCEYGQRAESSVHGQGKAVGWLTHDTKEVPVDQWPDGYKTEEYFISMPSAYFCRTVLKWVLNGIKVGIKRY